VPNCAFVRRTNVHCRPAPVIPVTVIPEELASVATKTNSNSFPEVVLNGGVAMLVAEVDRSVNLTTSTPRLPQAGVAAITTNKNRNACRLPRVIHEPSAATFRFSIKFSLTS
jgi:hypothetical protein